MDMNIANNMESSSCDSKCGIQFIANLCKFMLGKWGSSHASWFEGTPFSDKPTFHVSNAAHAHFELDVIILILAWYSLN